MLKDVIGYEGIYVISDKGEVFSLRTQKFLAQSTKRNGYKVVTLYKDGVKKQHLIHRLVCMTFNEDEDHSLQVNHIDCDKENNSLLNLEFVTSKENINHAFVNGRHDASLSKKMKRVEQIDIKTGETIKIWKSVSEAYRSGYKYVAQAAGTFPKAKKTHAGYKWRYLEDE